MFVFGIITSSPTENTHTYEYKQTYVNIQEL